MMSLKLNLSAPRARRRDSRPDLLLLKPSDSGVTDNPNPRPSSSLVGPSAAAPRPARTGQGVTDAALFDILGRRFFVGVNKRF
jgi:hypothetical protein